MFSLSLQVNQLWTIFVKLVLYILDERVDERTGRRDGPYIAIPPIGRLIAVHYKYKITWASTCIAFWKQKQHVCLLNPPTFEACWLHGHSWKPKLALVNPIIKPY